jgi:hypothetical protein
MKKPFLLSVVACIILASCNEQKDLSRVLPSITVEPSFMATSTSTRTQATKLLPTPTITPLPFYQTKQVVFDYYVIGDHSIYDFFFGLGSFRSYSRVILYVDGQMIIPGETYKQKLLSQSEIDQFLSRLETLGFYSLESNQEHDLTDKMYDFGNNYQKSYDGRLDCISVHTNKPRKLCVYEPDIHFLIPTMKNILQYLDEYEPAGTTPYYPDRILLWVQAGRDPYNDNLPETAVPWAEHLPSLETSNPIMYVDGNMAKEIYTLFESANAGKVFTQNGKEYTVYFDVVLPHEKLTNAYQ